MKVGVVVFMLAAAFMQVKGEEIICPAPPTLDCGEGMISCPGDMGPNGCVGPSSCMDEVVGCTAVGCPALPTPPDCGEAIACPGGMDLLGCPAPYFCAPNGEACPVGTK